MTACNQSMPGNPLGPNDQPARCTIDHSNEDDLDRIRSMKMRVTSLSGFDRFQHVDEALGTTWRDPSGPLDRRDRPRSRSGYIVTKEDSNPGPMGLIEVGE